MYQTAPVNAPSSPRPAQSPIEIWAGEISSAPPRPSAPTYPSASSSPSTPVPPVPIGATELDMTHGLSESVIGDPQTVNDAYMGSLKAMLTRNIGSHISASFLMGTQNMISWEGILHDVGNNYLTIYQPDKGRYVVGDFYSLKFAEFYEPSRSKAYIQQSQVDGWPQSI